MVKELILDENTKTEIEKEIEKLRERESFFAPQHKEADDIERFYDSMKKGR